jgi:DNA-binding NarL/FixJ family response regulator
MFFSSNRPTDCADTPPVTKEALVFHRGWFQVAVCDERLGEAVRRVLVQYGTAKLSRVAAGEWPALADSARYAGVIAEFGPGFEAWVERLRETSPGLPVLALMSRLDPALLNALSARAVEVALVPLHAPQLVSFVQRALASSFVPHERVARVVAYLAQARQLTAREVQLLSYCLGDEPRARVRRRLGITENTLKTQVKALLRKCGERNVDSLGKNVLRAALLEQGTRADGALAPWLPADSTLPALEGAA